MKNVPHPQRFTVRSSASAVWSPALPWQLLWVVAALLSASLVTSFAAKSSSPATEQVRKLAQVLQSEAAQKEKADACRELARIGNAEAIAALGALLPDETHSHMARYALETIPSAKVDKVFRAGLGKLQGRPLVGVIGSIGVRRDDNAVKPLARLLADPNPDVAQAAARALGSIATPSAGKALQKALPGASAGNQLAFCEGLFRCAERLAAEGHQKQAVSIYDSLRKTPPLHQARTAALRGAVLARQKNGLPVLIEALRSGEFGVFAAAARISAELPGEQVTQALASELPDASADKQMVLAQTLGRRGDRAALPALFAAAKNCQTPVRIAALKAIAEFSDASAVPLLCELMEEEGELAQAAQEALGALPGKEADAAALVMFHSTDDARRNKGLDLIVRRRMTSAIPELYTAAGSAVPQLRVAAVRKIAELADQREIPGLLNLLGKAKSPQDLEAAEQALNTVGLKAPDRDRCAQTLSANLNKSQPAQKCALVRVLGAVSGPTALKTVRASVKDS
ncbi:MAG: HEAT repeat domain-containing protein, partial [Chloroflexi bacterium]